MKRYVKEFANDILNSDKKNPLMKQEFKDKHKKLIASILEDCEAGLITNAEAVYQLATISY